MFQELISPDRDITRLRFQKTIETCRLAGERGILHIWVDSYINKDQQCPVDGSDQLHAPMVQVVNYLFHLSRKLGRRFRDRL
jgi:hypothetical protein